MNKQEMVEKVRVMAEVGDAATMVGITVMGSREKLRHLATAGAVVATATGACMVLGATGVAVKTLFVASVGAMAVSFTRGLRLGIAEAQAEVSGGKG